MKENLKNDNEYIEDGKHFIKAIKACRCDEWYDGYILKCKIKERGNHDYVLSEDKNYICKPNSEKRFYLEEEAKKTIQRAVDEFEENTNLGNYRQAQISKNAHGYYKHNKLNPAKYDFVLVYFAEDQLKFKKFRKNITLSEMIREIDWSISTEKLYGHNEAELAENPIYKEAVESNDKTLQKQLRVFYRLETKEEASWLSKLLGKRVLPTLPEEYDKTYNVDRDTIDFSMLERSCYVILHRPYFAMMNSTHEVYQLNPHTKEGVDAATRDEPSISFNDFLELFDN